MWAHITHGSMSYMAKSGIWVQNSWSLYNSIRQPNLKRAKDLNRDLTKEDDTNHQQGHKQEYNITGH